MAYPTKTKNNAIALRRKGYSLKEIATTLHIPKTTLWGWLQSISLDRDAQTRLHERIVAGRATATKHKRLKVEEKTMAMFIKVHKELHRFRPDPVTLKAICALIYWCEGVKDRHSGVRFMNSDPRLVEFFLKLLRDSFELDEMKFRVCVHLHQYHDVKGQLKFWSKVTGIPISRFTKPYIKRNTGKRVRVGYNGCASVRYHDVEIARQLLVMAESILNRLGA